MLEERHSCSVNLVIVGVRADELDETNPSSVVERDDHTIVTALDFKPNTAVLKGLGLRET